MLNYIYNYRYLGGFCVSLVERLKLNICSGNIIIKVVKDMHKNIVITGSTKGIGLSMAKEFLKMNSNVTISGRSDALSIELENELYRYKDNYVYVKCDVTKMDDVKDLWTKSKEHWGRIDIWINNAGINTSHEYIWETCEEYTNNVIHTNILGMIYGSQVAAENMLKENQGAIYSMEGLGSNNMLQKKTILYGTTKHALSYFMKGLAKELEGRGVIAGCLYPGMMLTDFITKSPDGKKSEVLTDDSFKKIFNILGDYPETIAKFFVPKMLSNSRNGIRIAWLTNWRILRRFICAIFKKRNLI